MGKTPLPPLNGVRCVIAAGWAVDDEQAKVFATTFYDQILNGHPFIDAVAEARQAAQALGGNTWAAYQCYGDPDWHLRVRLHGGPEWMQHRTVSWIGTTGAPSRSRIIFTARA